MEKLGCIVTVFCKFIGMKILIFHFFNQLDVYIFAELYYLKFFSDYQSRYLYYLFIYHLSFLKLNILLLKGTLMQI